MTEKTVEKTTQQNGANKPANGESKPQNGNGSGRKKKAAPVVPQPAVPAIPRYLDMSLTPWERIQARHDSKKAEREALRAKIGDPVEYLSKLLGDIPREVMEEDLETDENGLIRVKKSAYRI